MGGFQRGMVYSVQGTANRAVINVITRCTVCSGWLKLYIDVLDFVYRGINRSFFPSLLFFLFFFLSFSQFVNVPGEDWIIFYTMCLSVVRRRLI